jgi:hypothetical protein
VAGWVADRVETAQRVYFDWWNDGKGIPTAVPDRLVAPVADDRAEGTETMSGDWDEEHVRHLLATGATCLHLAGPSTRDDEGLPFDGLDLLRHVAQAGRLGVPQEELAESHGLCPGSLAVLGSIVTALEADGKLEELVGPLPEEHPEQ